MVRFEKDRFIIEITTGCNPAEYWLELYKGLLELVCNVTADNIDNETFYTVPDFLRELLPDWETVKLMIRD